MTEQFVEFKVPGLTAAHVYIDMSRIEAIEAVGNNTQIIMMSGAILLVELEYLVFKKLFEIWRQKNDRSN
jgi:hypothetical protein